MQRLDQIHATENREKVLRAESKRQKHRVTMDQVKKDTDHHKMQLTLAIRKEKLKNFELAEQHRQEIEEENFHKVEQVKIMKEDGLIIKEKNSKQTLLREQLEKQQKDQAIQYSNDLRAASKQFNTMEKEEMKAVEKLRFT